MSTAITDEFVTVSQAATICRVSQSTMWRWIDSGELPAYRLGRRRVLVKRADLSGLLVPARQPGRKGQTTKYQEQQVAAPLTTRERKQILGAVEQAKRLQAELLERRAGQPFPSSSEILNELRDERSVDVQ